MKSLPFFSLVVGLIPPSDDASESESSKEECLRNRKRGPSDWVLLAGGLVAALAEKALAWKRNDLNTLLTFSSAFVKVYMAIAWFKKNFEYINVHLYKNKLLVYFIYLFL